MYSYVDVFLEFYFQIEELREMGLPSKQKEEQMWDVQTAVTLLNRKVGNEFNIL